MQISFHKGSRISVTLHKENNSRCCMTFPLGAACTSHTHPYIYPSLHVRAREGNREPGETMEGRSAPRGTFTFLDTNITSLLSPLAATLPSSSLKNLLQMSQSWSLRWKAAGRLQFMLDYGSPWWWWGWQGPWCRAAWAWVQWDPARAELMQMPQLKPRRVTEAGEAAEKSLGVAVSPVVIWRQQWELFWCL